MSTRPRSQRLRRAWHLVRRFFGALAPGAPSTADEAWVRQHLAPDLFDAWSSMPNHDRRHSIGVARRFQAGLSGSADADDDRWIAAALLHDLGKLDSGLGVFGRVAATLARAAFGRTRTDRWIDGRGLRRRYGLYLRHDRLGADRIRAAGGTEPVARWAAAHHDAAQWADTGIPERVMVALDAADDD